MSSITFSTNDSVLSYCTTQSLNTALDELGLLSTVTSSRKQFLQEKAGFAMMDSLPGPSCFKAPSSLCSQQSCSSGISSQSMMQQGPIISQQESFPKPASLPLSPFGEQHHDCALSGFDFHATRLSEAKDTKNSSGTEKENNLFSGFKVLTMNSKFITNFKNDYSLPHHVSGANRCMHSCIESFADKQKWYHKASVRNVLKRRRLRTHPYENVEGFSTCRALFEMLVTDHSLKEKDVPACYRVRTTSLSSGVCGGKIRKRPDLQAHHGGGQPKDLPTAGSSSSYSVPAASAGVTAGLWVRSRSMEDLSAALDDDSDAKGALTAVLRTGEVENVSRAIQQLCVHDRG